MTSKTAGRALLCLFVLSGIAGLIYQSVWSQYLGLTLGHAAYAQTLVLTIYMGGMALGAWLVSRKTTSWSRLILYYGIVEAVIGVLGLTFQALFEFYTQFSRASVLPALNNETLAHTYQWLSAALIIFPQSLLLGATFPLLSAGYLRIAPHQDGQVLGGLYFTNSLGAALGALAATFLLLPAVGLPGSVMTAGILNIIVGLGAWLVSRRVETAVVKPTVTVSSPPAQMQISETPVASTGEVRRLGRIMLAATALSGGTSFIYEMGWIRMLNQALGSSIHSFELMLAAFISGLAFGGLWIRRRSNRIQDPVRYVGYVQVWMGIAALLSIPVFAQSFRWVGWIMDALSRTDGGYTLFEISTALISLSVMFPAAFFAGMTLPLFTMALLRAGADERAIGRIYAANTLGSIIGVAIMVHLLIPLIGVKFGFMLAAILDILLGFYLLKALSPGKLTRGLTYAATATLAAMGISISLGQVDPTAQVSGVFRTGSARLGGQVLFLKDGKTATVGIYRSGVTTGISTNGKPDAGLRDLDSPPSEDEFTMVLLGSLPLMRHPNPEDIALIGWGSGLSTHTALGSATPKNVDTIEIESVMYEAAKLFGSRVERAYSDPRSHLRLNDARTYFSTGARRYDVIVSEPSNPWVSGVANLFTAEFYAFLKDHLKEGGMLVQWLHMYEISDPLVATMLAALISEFPHAELYLTNNADIVILASEQPLPPMQENFWGDLGVLEEELTRVQLNSVDEINLRKIGSEKVIRHYVQMLDARPYSDYFPAVALQAPKTRFRNQKASILTSLTVSGLPTLDILDCRSPPGEKARVTFTPASSIGRARQEAIRVQRIIENGELSSTNGEGSTSDGIPVYLYTRTVAGLSPHDPAFSTKEWGDSIGFLAKMVIDALPPEDLRSNWNMSPHWIAADTLEVPLLRAIFHAFVATAERDVIAMKREAELALSMGNDETMSSTLREQLVAIAMLGAIGIGDHQAAIKLHEDHPNIAGNMINTRNFMLAWAKNGVSACATPTTPITIE